MTGPTVDLTARVNHYHASFPKFPPSLVGCDRWISGSWVLGNDYRSRSGYYGSYPPGYVRRVRALFPDYVPEWRVLHLFAGTVPSENPLPGVRVDLHAALRPDVAADAHALPFAGGVFDLVVADPPYTPADAERYGTPMIRRRKVLAEVARVTRPGGHLVWLDTTLPRFRKAEWHWWGVIGVWRSSNHRVRGCHCFQRATADPARLPGREQRGASRTSTTDQFHLQFEEEGEP